MRLLCIVLVSTALWAVSPPDLGSLVSDSLRFMDPDRNQQREYSYVVHHRSRHLDAEGKTVATESTTTAHTFVDGIAIRRTLERNGQKLSPAEARTEEQRITTHVAEEKSLSDAERQRRKTKQSERSDWIKEVPDALDFTYAGEEIIAGRPAIVVLCSPRPGYSAHNIRARMLERIKGKLWVDKEDRELVRAEAETTDTVTIGFGLLGRLEKGTRFSMHRKKLPDGSWVPDWQQRTSQRGS